MQFRVPQNIAMEDRIVGPLTAMQFGILVIGLGIAFLIYSSLSLPDLIREGGGAFFAILTITLSVGKFNDQPMHKFFRFIIAFATSPKVRVWRKTGKEVGLIRPAPINTTEDQHHVVKNTSRKDIARLAAILDSRGQSSTPLTRK